MSLEGAGLRLEPQTALHAPAMYALLRDPALYEFLDQGPPASEAALLARFTRLQTRRSPDGSQHWLNWVVRLADDRLAGHVQATVYPDQSAHIAYVLGHAFWGRGIALEATRRLLDELRRGYPVRQAFATVDRRNARSLRLLQRLGFAILVDNWPPHAAPQPGDAVLARTLHTP
jgi:RimJ/RimL family protein N-acetyltransferase